MGLASGTRLGPYEIGDAVGAGGMGEVYRARDTRLDRTVAVKVLPTHFSSDPAFRERFDREARSIAALNHPHICTLHDVGHDQGNDFLVMELVEGETLAERLAQGSLSIAESLGIAQQVADALEAAHDKGILHRDLKPANIKVTPEGSVKVLDFGLAKALGVDADATSGAVSLSPTFSRLATQAGMIMGTAAYMSPEQARGKSVDRRTDVWAFGCVLYEMLSGKPAFGGETITDILGAIVHKEPDWNALPHDTPPRLRELLERCLQKDVRQRLRDMGDARLEIERVRAVPISAPAVPLVAPAAARRRWVRAVPWVVAGLLAIALGMVTTAWWRETSRVPPVTRVHVEITPKAPFAPAWGPAAVLSADGTELAYVAGSGNDRRLYVRRLDQLEGTVLSGTDGAVSPFWSPDGSWIGYFASESLKKVAASGGAPLTLATLGQGRGGTWGGNDTIVFSPLLTGGLSRLSAAGGTPEPITTLDPQKERSHRWPQFLPGDNAVLFTVQLTGTRWDESNIETVDLTTKQRKIVHRGGTFARYVASGHLLFVRESTMFAAPFDVKRLEVTASPVPVLEGVGAQTGVSGTGVALFDVASNGTLAYLTSAPLGEAATLVLVDRKGVTTRLSEERENHLGPRFSPDGTRIAMFRPVAATPPDVWIYDIARSSFRRLTFAPVADAYPIWTPDGQRVTYVSGVPGNLYWVAADSSGQPERLTQSNNGQRPGSWSPDGKVLMFAEVSAGNNVDLWTLRLDGDRKPQVFLQTPAVESNPEFSPDGRWVAYQSDESGRMEIYVRSYPDSGGKWQISNQGGAFPRWSRDGRELFYRISGDRVMSVAITNAAGRSLQYDQPRELFKDTFAARGATSMYDVTADGKRFVMVQDVSAATPGETHLTLVFNWFEDLKERLAMRR